LAPMAAARVRAAVSEKAGVEIRRRMACRIPCQTVRPGPLFPVQVGLLH
jgi:hypothetical protein